MVVIMNVGPLVAILVVVLGNSDLAESRGLKRYKSLPRLEDLQDSAEVPGEFRHLKGHRHHRHHGHHRNPIRDSLESARRSPSADPVFRVPSTGIPRRHSSAIYGNDRVRRKRHNGKHLNSKYEPISEEDMEAYRRTGEMPYPSKRRNINYFEDDREMDEDVSDETSYEIELKEAQNTSVCGYRVEAIPDPDGTRAVKDLEHVVCNRAGSRCKDTGIYCCLQTYRMIQVPHIDGRMETLKIYTGCVCSLQFPREVEAVSYGKSLDY